MTIAEKLRVMESLWRDLSRDEAQLESPKFKRARRKPLHCRPLEEFLAERNRR